MAARAILAAVAAVIVFAARAVVAAVAIVKVLAARAVRAAMAAVAAGAAVAAKPETKWTRKKKGGINPECCQIHAELLMNDGARPAIQPQ